MNLRTMTSSALLLFVACRPGEGPTSAFSNDPHAVPITLIRFRTDSTAFAQYSGINRAQNFVIRDAARWNRLWQQVYATVDPMPPPPIVDFDQEMVVGVALGARATGGYDVLLKGAAADAAGMVIAAEATSPGAHCVTTQAFTHPIDVGRLARSNLPVRFTLTHHVVDCGS